MKDDKNEITETLDTINMNVRAGLLALVAVAIQIRDGDDAEITTERQLERAAELLRLSTTALRPLF
jgi:hypothetical protein